MKVKEVINIDDIQGNWIKIVMPLNLLLGTIIYFSSWYFTKSENWALVISLCFIFCSFISLVCYSHALANMEVIIDEPRRTKTKRRT